MNSKIWRVLEIFPMLIYLVACIACSTYFLYSFMGLYVQQLTAPTELAFLL